MYNILEKEISMDFSNIRILLFCKIIGFLILFEFPSGFKHLLLYLKTSKYFVIFSLIIDNSSYYY